MKSKIFTIFFLLSFYSYSQEMDQQFSELMENTETFKNYKVIKIEDLDAFWKVIQDSSNRQKETIVELKLKNETSMSAFEKAMKESSEKDQVISDLNEQISSIGVLGMNIDKTVFKVFTFSIIGVLLIVLVFFFLKLQERISTAGNSIKELESLKDQYESFKKDSLDKQMKLRRELQTAQNRLDEKRSTI